MGSVRRQVEARKRAQQEDTLEDSFRFAVDQLLREHGFAIMSRPKGREATWTRRGKRYPQHLALMALPAKDVIRARALERNCRERRGGDCEGR